VSGFLNGGSYEAIRRGSECIQFDCHEVRGNILTVRLARHRQIQDQTVISRKSGCSRSSISAVCRFTLGKQRLGVGRSRFCPTKVIPMYHKPK
jgi:hypothetical protein